jgi:hypothetical protein
MTDASCNCESGVCVACEKGDYCYKGKCFTRSTSSGTTDVQTDNDGSQGTTDGLQENEVPDEVVEDELKDSASSWIYIVVIALILSSIGGFMLMRMRSSQALQPPAQLPPQLYQWVAYYRSGGMNDEQIRAMFLKSGYTAQQIDQLLRQK